LLSRICAGGGAGMVGFAGGHGLGALKVCSE
jgi:hypothetical protein